MSVSQPQPIPPMTVASGTNRNANNLPVGAEGRKWSHGLFDCFATPATCVVSWFCPCVTYGRVKRRYEHLNSTGTPLSNAEQDDIFNRDCMLNGCLHLTCRASVILEFMLRKNVRGRYNIKGGSAEDCCVAYWCTPCELTQESREIELEESTYGPKY